MKSTRLALVSPLMLMLFAACGSDDNTATTPPPPVFVDGGIMTGVPIGSSTDSDASLGSVGGDDTTGGDDTGPTDASTGSDGSMLMVGDDDSSLPPVDSGMDSGTDGSTPGSAVIAVVRIGNGTDALGSTTTTNASFVEFRDATGTVTKTVTLPTASSATALTVSSSSLDGEISRSTDGHYLLVPGYNAAPGTDLTTAVPRILGRVDSTGVLDLTTTVTGAFTGSNIRGAASKDGTTLYAAGTTSGSTTGGIWTIQKGSTTPTQIATAPQNSRSVQIFNNQLYVSSGVNGSNGVLSVGTGTPTTGTNTATLLTTGFAGNPTSFLAVGATATTVDTLYIADATSTSGIQKWVSVAGVWTKEYTITVAGTGCLGVTGSIDATNATVTLYALSAGTQNGIYKYTDTRATLTPPTSLAATALTNGLAPSATAFRGIALVPN